MKFQAGYCSSVTRRKSTWEERKLFAAASLLCINRSHFQSENNLVVVANCACPLLSIHSNLRII